MRPTLRILGVIAAALALAACHHDTGKDNLKAAQGFLKTNGAQPGVVTLPSGLEYKVVKSGPATGQHPSVSDEVKVNYEGKLLSGTVFDSSFDRGEPVDFPLSGLIPAWGQALVLMRPGDEWILYVPPSLGYGDKGAGPIPPNSLLIFRIQLVDFMHGPPQLG